MLMFVEAVNTDTLDIQSTVLYLCRKRRTSMKKLAYLAVTLLILIGITITVIACGKKKSEKSEEIIPTEMEAEVVQSVIVVDEDYYSMIFTKYDTDEFGDFYIDVFCENMLSDKVLVFSIDRVSVNNYMIDPWWAVEVKPGCGANSTIWFSKAELDKNDIDHVINVNFDVSVYNSDDLSEDSIYEENFDLMVN